MVRTGVMLEEGDSVSSSLLPGREAAPGWLAVLDNSSTRNGTASLPASLPSKAVPHPHHHERRVHLHGHSTPHGAAHGGVVPLVSAAASGAMPFLFDATDRESSMQASACFSASLLMLFVFLGACWMRSYGVSKHKDPEKGRPPPSEVVAA